MLTIDDVILEVMENPKSKKTKDFIKVCWEFLWLGNPGAPVMEIDGEEIFMVNIIEAMLNYLTQNPKAFKMGSPKGCKEMEFSDLIGGEWYKDDGTLRILLLGMGLYDKKNIPSMNIRPYVHKETGFVEHKETLRILDHLGKKKTLFRQDNPYPGLK